MIKSVFKLFIMVVGFLLITGYIIFPALTAPNTFYNLGGLFLFLGIILFILKYSHQISEDFSSMFLDEDEMKKVYEIRKEQGKPTTTSKPIKEQTKRKYTKKTK